MDIIILGLGTVIAVVTILLGYSVLGVVKLGKKVEELLHRNISRDIEIERLERELHYRIDGDCLNLENSISTLEGNVDKQLDEVWRQMDSRLDKLENRITSKIPPTNEEVLKELEKVRKEFLSLRQNL